MSKGGRPSKYDTDVKPRLEEISEWLRIGATDKEIAENLGIAAATFGEYKKKYSEFSEFVKNNRRRPVQDIKAALYRKAVGFTYSEKKIIIEGDEVVREEIYEKYSLPDPASAMILLKHWARDEGWTNDPAFLALKKRELELKEQAAKDEWK